MAGERAKAVTDELRTQFHDNNNLKPDDEVQAVAFDTQVHAILPRKKKATILAER